MQTTLTLRKRPQSGPLSPLSGKPARKRQRPLIPLSGPLDLAAVARTALALRQPIVFVAPQSSSDETTALKQRVAELEAQLVTAQAAAVARLQREERVAAITFAEVDNRAAYAAKTARRTAPAKVVITTAHVDVP